MSAIRAAGDFQDDGAVHQAIENRHRYGSIAKIFRPSFEVDVRDQGRETLRTAAIDQFVEQAGRLGRFASFDFVEAEIRRRSSARSCRLPGLIVIVPPALFGAP